MAERYELVTQTGQEGTEERTTEEIRQDIAARRESIAETVDKLSERVQRSLDWRSYVTEHPFLATGLAAGAGFLVASLFRPQPTPQERLLAALSETVEDVADRFRGQLDRATSTPSLQTSMQAMATAWLTKTAVNYLNNKFVAQSNSNRNSTQYSRPASETENAFRATSGVE